LKKKLSAATTDQFQQYSIAEANEMWDLTQAGVIRESYFHADRNEVMLVLECASVAEAEETLSTWPVVQNKLIEFELIPLKAYPGFERLFAKA